MTKKMRPNFSRIYKRSLSASVQKWDMNTPKYKILLRIEVQPSIILIHLLLMLKTLDIKTHYILLLRKMLTKKNLNMTITIHHTKTVMFLCLQKVHSSFHLLTSRNKPISHKSTQNKEAHILIKVKIHHFNQTFITRMPNCAKSAWQPKSTQFAFHVDTDVFAAAVHPH